MPAALPRLFVALRPPAEIREVLYAAMGGVEAARWQGDDQLHLTLRFIGEIDPHRADDLLVALQRIDAHKFDLAIRGVGHFERKGRATALWAAVAPSPALDTLQKKVERACQSVGLEPEHRKFTPHVTLARLAGGAGPIGRWLADHANLSAPAWPVAYFSLFESTLAITGSQYDAIAEWPLR
ncbi:RNA 2',3'-cyclic phosphodiesterase [Tsuneonella mangrovi]|uniref:RNA 2',3'-cyclic phosphodiesterase n=1 Tax=Tsuneonella mangrovi TaxID=1982042 RepID=UPI001F0A30E0|nr:RNA 2',3'-cyclic phosphodiesterase [Tsuneonella mangrovi]